MPFVQKFLDSVQFLDRFLDSKIHQKLEKEKAEISIATFSFYVKLANFSWQMNPGKSG